MSLTFPPRWHSGLLALLLVIAVTTPAGAAVIHLNPSLSDPTGKVPESLITLSTKVLTGGGKSADHDREAALEFMPHYAAAVQRTQQIRALDILTDPNTLQLQNSSVYSALFSAQAAFNDRDYVKAIAFAREAIKVDNAEAKAYFMLGSSMLALGRKEEAREAFGRALRIQPEYPEAMSNLAVLRYQDGEIEPAILLLIHALEQKIDYQNAWKNYLALLPKILLPEENLPALPLPPDDAANEKLTPARWHWKQAIAAMEAQDAELATLHFLSSLTLNINDPNTHNDFAVFLQRVDRKLLALPFLRAAAHLSPDAPLVEQNLEVLARELQLEQLAEQAETLTNNLAAQDNAADRLALARTLREQGRDIEEVLAHLQKAVALEPEDVSYRIELIETLDLAGRHRDAISILRPALASAPDNPRWHLRMAQLLVAQPEPSAADLAQAVDNARRACELTEFTRKDCLQLLAELLDAAGDRENARAMRNKAKAL